MLVCNVATMLISRKGITIALRDYNRASRYASCLKTIILCCLLFCRRIDYLERVVPAVTRLQRVWRTVRERAFVADMRWLCIRVQSHARRILLMQEQKKLQPLKNFFVGAVILAGIAYAFRRLGLSDEVVNAIKTR